MFYSVQNIFKWRVPRSVGQSSLKCNPLPCNPSSSVISTPFKPPLTLFFRSLPHYPPLPSHLFHLTPDGALSLNAVGSRGLRFRVSCCCIGSCPALWDSCFLPDNRELLATTVQLLCYCVGVGSADIVPSPGTLSLICACSASDTWEMVLWMPSLT